jgi:hypothetical protein
MAALSQSIILNYERRMSGRTFLQIVALIFIAAGVYWGVVQILWWQQARVMAAEQAAPPPDDGSITVMTPEQQKLVEESLD